MEGFCSFYENRAGLPNSAAQEHDTVKTNCQGGGVGAGGEVRTQWTRVGWRHENLTQETSLDTSLYSQPGESGLGVMPKAGLRLRKKT